jgi:hypothetical protein
MTSRPHLVLYRTLSRFRSCFAMSRMRPFLFSPLIALAILQSGVSSPMFAQGTRASRNDASPGALIVATNEGLPAALRFADKLADGGVVVLVRQYEAGVSSATVAWEARVALDSLRRRQDIRTADIGVIAVGTGEQLFKTLAADTTLAFVVTVDGNMTAADGAAYLRARVPTLVLRPPSIAIDTMTASTLTAVTAESVGSGPNAMRGEGVRLTRTVGNLVTVWPVSSAMLARLHVPLDPTAERVVQWVRQRVRLSETNSFGSPVHALDAVVVQ